MKSKYNNRSGRNNLSENEDSKTCWLTLMKELCLKSFRILFTPKFYDKIWINLKMIACGSYHSYSHPNERVIYYDITRSGFEKRTTGVQRVVREIYQELNKNRVAVQPVVADLITKKYRAVKWDGINPVQINSSQEIEIKTGDIFLCLDIAWYEQILTASVLKRYKNKGCDIYLAVHDVLPIEFENYFPKGTAAIQKLWLNRYKSFAQFITFSEDVRKKVSCILGIPLNMSIGLGANFHSEEVGNSVLNQCRQEKTADRIINFLMVGTIEPRKGHELVLASFERMMKADSSIPAKLKIIGKEGWMCKRIIKKIKEISRKHTWLEWDQNCNDQKLKQAYLESDVVIIASEGEGFGLPVIEAMLENKTLIVRDIPVFREIIPKEYLNNVSWFGGSGEEIEALLLKHINESKIVKVNAGREIGQVIADRFSWSRCCKDLLEMMRI